MVRALMCLEQWKPTNLNAAAYHSAKEKKWVKRERR
jgi:hypothetical protein